VGGTPAWGASDDREEDAMSPDVASVVFGGLLGFGGTRVNDWIKERAARRQARAVTLRTKVNEICRVSDACLAENGKALSGLPSDRRRVAANMHTLSTEPRQLALFAGWERFLGNSLANETDKRVKAPLIELLAGVLDLERAFYTDYTAAEAIQDEAIKRTMKSFVAGVLTGEDTWSDEAVLGVANEYLAFLKTAVVRIGKAGSDLETLLV